VKHAIVPTLDLWLCDFVQGEKQATDKRAVYPSPKEITSFVTMGKFKPKDILKNSEVLVKD